MAQKGQVSKTAERLVEAGGAAGFAVRKAAEEHNLVRMVDLEVGILAEVDLAGRMVFDEGAVAGTSTAEMVVRGRDIVAGIEVVSCSTPEAPRSLSAP